MKHIITCPNCGTTAATITITVPEPPSATPAPDWLAMFIENRCEVVEGARTTSRDMRSAYQEWAAANGGPEISAKRFGMAIGRLWGVRLYRGTAGVRVFDGIKLRDQRPKNASSRRALAS